MLLSASKLFAFLLIVLLAITGLYISSPERGLNLLVQTIEHSTPYSLELQDAKLAYRPFSFSAGLVTLHDKSVSDAPLVAVQALDVQMPFTQLLFGNSEAGTLSANNVTYFFDSAGSSEPMDFKALIAPLSRLPAYVEVDSLHVISRSKSVWIFPVTQIRGDRNQAGELQTSALVTIGQRSNTISAALNVVEESRDAARILVNARVSDADNGSRLELDGYIEGGADSLNYEASITGKYADVSDFVSAFDKDAYSFEGAIELTGTIKGDLDKYALELSRLSLATPNAYEFWATGMVSNSGPQLHPTLELRAGGDASRLSALLPLPEALASAIRQSNFDLTITGTLDEPVVEDATLHLIGDGQTMLDIRVPQQSLALSEFRAPSRSPPFDAEFVLQSQSLKTFTRSLDTEWPLTEDMRVTGDGVLSSDGDTFTGTLQQFVASTRSVNAQGSLSLRADKTLISLPSIKLAIQSSSQPEQRITASGTIADLEEVRGLALNARLKNVEPNLWAPLLELPLLPASFAGTVIDGEFLLLRASTPWTARDIELSLDTKTGAVARIAGTASYTADGPEADIMFELPSLKEELWANWGGTVGIPSVHDGKLRLRPNYATVIAQGTLGSSRLQVFLNADLLDGTATSIAMDLYSPELDLADVNRLSPENEESDKTSTPNSVDSLRALLRTPLQVTARADRLVGEQTSFRRFAIEVEADDDLIVLRHFDTSYASGYLQLRGAMSLQGQPALSLAGEGLRVPLGALTSDLGIQQTVEGELTLRGGLSSQGSDHEEWLSRLNGSIALAASGTTVSGAAYDQLMSNILGWLVTGASERTTTFDCSMLQLQFKDGIANSNDVYIETPRMRASGKARLDLVKQELDIRLEPRSKQRTIQFPSAVNIEGPLTDPEVRVSPLQATFDLSAQTLLLLPGLTLKLFGLGADQQPLRPCEATLEE